MAQNSTELIIIVPAKLTYMTTSLGFWGTDSRSQTGVEHGAIILFSVTTRAGSLEYPFSDAAWVDQTGLKK